MTADFGDEVAAIVRDKQLNVEAALSEVIERVMRTFDKVADAYLRERATDIRDIGRRVLDVLVAGHVADTCAIPDRAIVVADELLPSSAARLEFNRVQRAFSVAPGEMLAVKRALREMRIADAEEMARGALELGSTAEIEDLLPS